MEELHFDFTTAATRGAIIDGLHAALGDEAWADVERAARAVAVPDRHHHNLAEISETVAGLGLPARVADDVLGVYGVLAEAEATAHGCSVEQTHFHEVGDAAAIANTLLICFGFAAADAKRVTATPVQTGSGTVECAHGTMDIPAPATAAIIARGIPVCADKREGELCTPTSAAIIFHFVDGFDAR